MKKSYIIVLFILVLAAALSAFFIGRKKPELIATVTYMCDKEKTITASYYEVKPEPIVVPGQAPKPEGSVRLSFGDKKLITLKQTLSGSGVRYANKDESLVFWNKGDEVLVMRNNVMDLNYTNCLAKK